MNMNDIVTTFHPAGDDIAWQPGTMVPIKTDHRSRYPGMKTDPIKIFSAFCVILGLASIGIQIAALLMTLHYVYAVHFLTDLIGHGIWAGLFYVISGSLGIASACKRTKSHLVSTVVFSALSIAPSFVSSFISGIAASFGCYYEYSNSTLDELCEAWVALEWSLMSISLLALVSSIILLVLTSIALCCSRSNKKTIGYYYQQEVHLGPIIGQHPVQQLYQPNFQTSNVTPQFQQQHQMQLVAAPTV